MLIRLPRLFYEHFASRGHPAGTVLYRGARRVTLEISQFDLSAILTDAEFYASLKPLVRSAEMTVNAIRRSL